MYDVGIDPLDGVVMLALTNRVDILDQALLRPGRFYRQILINLPTLPERKAIFKVYLKKILLEKSVDAYSSRLAALTLGHSGMRDDCNIIIIEPEIFAGRKFSPIFPIPTTGNFFTGAKFCAQSCPHTPTPSEE